MRYCLVLALVIFISSAGAQDQSHQSVADSIRIEYGIPEIGYAVVSADSIIEINTLGFKMIHKEYAAEPNDKFHLGSIAKSVTGLVAALLLKQEKIEWDTKFFDLMPELKQESDSRYWDMTLVDLLGHRAWLQPFTDENEYPDRKLFSGSVAEQRRQFVAWALKLEPIVTDEPFSYSNAGYSAAAVMLERVSGKTWEDLILELGNQLGLDFGFSFPDTVNHSQPWGHSEVDSQLVPGPPSDVENLFLVAPAGDLNLSINHLAKLIQINLRGLQGRCPLLSQEEFEFLHYGLEDHYSIGWSWGINDKGHHISAHTGSAGTFFCLVYISREVDRGYVLVANSGTERTENGLIELRRFLVRKHGT
jgi:CubicO group peptidase (beta-lactamase class C family)